jgi:hypothetical protein
MDMICLSDMTGSLHLDERRRRMRKAASFRRSMTRRFVGIVSALAVGLLALGALNAQAALIPDVSGNTQPVFNSSSPTGVAGFINFAVFNTVDGTPTDSFDTGVPNANAILLAAGFNPNAAYLYLFQVTNRLPNPLTGGAAPEISTATVHVTSGSVDGFGTLAGIGAEYNGNALHGGDPGVTFGPPAAAGNQSPAVTGVSGASASFTTPGLTTATVTLQTPTSLLANFAPDGTIPAGGQSDIWGYTSNLPPTLSTGSLQDDGTSAVGTIPSTVPEPSSIVMLASAVSVGAVLLLRRRAKRGATPPSA